MNPVPSAEEVAFILGLPRWSADQRRAVVDLARTRAGEGLTDEELSVLLGGAAGLGGATEHAQRTALALLARRIGIDRLVGATKLEGEIRLGAAWLLIEEGSAQALRAVAALGDDKHEGIRVAAALATSLLRPRSSDPAVRDG